MSRGLPWSAGTQRAWEMLGQQQETFPEVSTSIYWSRGTLKRWVTPKSGPSGPVSSSTSQDILCSRKLISHPRQAIPWSFSDPTFLQHVLWTSPSDR